MKLKQNIPLQNPIHPIQENNSCKNQINLYFIFPEKVKLPSFFTIFIYFVVKPSRNFLKIFDLQRIQDKPEEDNININKYFIMFLSILQIYNLI